MNKTVNFKFYFFIALIIFGVVFSYPSFMQSENGRKISLGLDLQGGLYMLLGVKTEEAIKTKIKSIASSVKYFADEKDILVDGFKISDDFISFELLDKDEIDKIDTFLSSIEGLIIDKDGLSYRLSITTEERGKIAQFAIAQAVETIRNRLDQFGLAEPNVAKQGVDKILVELPGIKTQEDELRARELISKSAHLQLMAIDEKKADQVNSMSDDEALDYGDLILSDVKNEKIKYLVHQIPILDGEMLTDARVGFDQNNQPVINFTLNSQGATIFGDFTEKNVGNRLAIVLDNKVYSAPVIRERIGGGSGQISGNFTPQEASDLAIALRSGALSAPVVMLEKRSVGPSLGADSIKASFIALLSGFIAVIVFMVFYYGISGVIANVAVLVNLLLIVSIMALFGATLTLPGMAGIVLTVGMAVDANVIIIERIRELLNENKHVRKAIEEGYSNAIRAIVDSNLTTLIAATVLYAYGTGPIKGFAVTISIGILSSMMTAITCTHGIYEYLLPKLNKTKNFKLWFGIKKVG